MTGLLVRIGSAALAVLLASVMCFVLAAAAPGDFYSALALQPDASPQLLDRLRAQHGLDVPLWQRYLDWLWGALRGELGYSLAHGAPVAPLLMERAGATLWLGLCAQLSAWMLILPLACAGLAGGRGTERLPRVAHGAAMLLLAIPEVVLALVVVLALSAGPAPGPFVPAWITLALVSAAALWLPLRTALQSAASSAHVAAARRLGVSPATLLLHYIMRAAAPSLIASFTQTCGTLLGASLLVECVTGYAGLGPLLLDAVLARDTAMVAAAVVLATLIWLVATLLGDVARYCLDPRARSSA